MVVTSESSGTDCDSDLPWQIKFKLRLYSFVNINLTNYKMIGLITFDLSNHFIIRKVNMNVLFNIKNPYLCYLLHSSRKE